MDYSGLVHALKNDDLRTVNRLCAEAIPILKKYLISKVDASPDDAEDAVQQMFEYVIPKIKKDEINSPTGLLSYMLTGARHSYYKIVRDFDLDKFDEIEEQLVSEPEQAWKLMNDDQATILLNCIEKLRNGYREFAKFLFDFPTANTEDIAERFDISPPNAWTRKHRVLKKLTDCVSFHS